MTKQGEASGQEIVPVVPPGPGAVVVEGADVVEGEDVEPADGAEVVAGADVVELAGACPTA